MSEIKDGGPAILVSPEDKYLLVDRWLIGSNGYVYHGGGRIKGKPCLLHRIIIGAKEGQEVHHRNGNKLDNRRENLELTTASEHQQHHISTLIARNKSSRIYPLIGICNFCGVIYNKDRDHRGRQVVCSKLCAIRKAAKISVEVRRGR